MTLSLCMIVKDEIDSIRECLDSTAPYVDEIVVVDTGSTDGTREVVEQYADQIIDFEWIDDFSAARNAGLERAKGEWILVLDADERISGADFEQLRAAIADAKAGGKKGFYLNQLSYTSANTEYGEWHAADPDDPNAKCHQGYILNPIMRLFLADPAVRYIGRIHEIVDGSMSAQQRGVLPVPIHHYPNDNPKRPRIDRVRRYLSMMEAELTKRDDARLLHIAAASMLQLGESFSKAEQYFRKAAELGYRPLKSLDGAAEAAYRRGNFGPALDLYRTVYESGYRVPSVCLNMANLLVKTGEKAKAADLLQECLDLGGFGAELNHTIERNIAVLRS